MAGPLKRPQGPRQWAAFWIATALGAGLVPKAPGTAGSAVALPIPLLVIGLSFGARAALWIAVTAIGIWAAKEWDRFQQSSDNQSIVIDEVVGLWLTAWTVHEWKALLAAFVLFRFFDVTKIPPVRQVDRWSKKKAKEPSRAAAWWGGFGVVADDVLAGVQGLLVVLFLQHQGWLP